MKEERKKVKKEIGSRERREGGGGERKSKLTLGLSPHQMYLSHLASAQELITRTLIPVKGDISVPWVLQHGLLT